MIASTRELAARNRPITKIVVYGSRDWDRGRDDRGRDFVAVSAVGMLLKSPIGRVFAALAH
jgi:hypothetical protein